MNLIFRLNMQYIQYAPEIYFYFYFFNVQIVNFLENINISSHAFHISHLDTKVNGF